jgi:hypothetical protein
VLPGNQTGNTPMNSDSQTPDTLGKALALNLNPARYGTFAEIGAGQEVVRWFFRAGGAAGTVAKAISAYDMVVSDAIYGECKRYVARERLLQMLEHEYELNLSRLTDAREIETSFFAFADTVKARGYRGGEDYHGWMGVRFQTEPGAPHSQIIIHARLLDREALLQQEALGMVGVNLVHAAFEYHASPDQLLLALLDGLSTARIEVDMADFSGRAFADVDNRIVSLKLVQLGLSETAMFSATGEVLQAKEVLRKQAVLVERGNFRPLTNVNVDMFSCASARFEENLEKGVELLPLMEITMGNLLEEGEVDLEDFLARADTMSATGVNVLISNYFEFFKLGQYLRRMTDQQIAVVLGAGTLTRLFDNAFYEELEGGLLEAAGRLFTAGLKLYIYPQLDRKSGELVTAESFYAGEEIEPLYRYLKSAGRIEALTDYQEGMLRIFPEDVLELIAAGDTAWREMVPAEVAEIIQARGLFGYCET